MSLTREDVLKVAALAQLELSEEDVERLGREMGAVLEYMERLREVDTSGVEPLAHVHQVHCPLRDDVSKPSLEVERGLADAPARDGTSFSVPRIIGEGS